MLFENLIVPACSAFAQAMRAGTTINNPKSLGLQKPVLYLQAYLWKGVECNNRFLDCCADVDVSSVTEEEQETFIKSVTDQTGRLVSAPDFRKDRQKALAKELLKPKYQVYGFKTADLYKNLSVHFRNPAQTCPPSRAKLYISTEK